MRRFFWAGAASLHLLVGGPPVYAQGVSSARPGEMPYVVPRIEEPILVDGRIDEPAWQGIDPLPVYMHVPTFGDPVTERTEFRFAYDSEYLYFSCQAYDSDPDGIRRFSLLRDESSFRSDFCWLYIDTLNDARVMRSKTMGAGTPSGT